MCILHHTKPFQDSVFEINFLIFRPQNSIENHVMMILTSITVRTLSLAFPLFIKLKANSTSVGGNSTPLTATKGHRHNSIHIHEQGRHTQTWHQKMHPTDQDKLIAREKKIYKNKETDKKK